MGAAEVGGHEQVVVEVGEGGVGIFGTGVEDGPCTLGYLLALLLRWLGPGEVVVDYFYGIVT